MAQFSRPSSDIEDQDFTVQPSGGFWEAIDEETYDDADYISGNALGAYCEVGCSSVTDPQSSSDHVFRYRLTRTLQNRKLTGVASLKCGSTEIASWTHTDPGTVQTYTQTLTSQQADSISDYTDLRFRFVVSSRAGGSLQVFWAEFEVPDAAGGQEYNETISTSCSAVVVLGKGAGKLLPEGAYVVSTLGKGIGATVPVAAIVQAVVTKGTNRILAVASSVVAVLARGKSLALTAVSSVAASIGRGVGKVLSEAALAIPVIGKSVGMAISVTAAVQTAITRGTSKTLSAVSSGVAALLTGKRVALEVVAFGVATVGNGVGKILATAALGQVVITRGLNRIFSAVSSAVAGAFVGQFRTLSATVNGVVDLIITQAVFRETFEVVALGVASLEEKLVVRISMWAQAIGNAVVQVKTSVFRTLSVVARGIAFLTVDSSVAVIRSTKRFLLLLSGRRR